MVLKHIDRVYLGLHTDDSVAAFAVHRSCPSGGPEAEPKPIIVDDFGTGYSSLSHLRELSITSMKIDRSFIASLPADSDGLAIARAVIELAKNLAVGAIAEGVETSAQLETIRTLGCHEAQGFLFSRPLPVDELRSRRSRYLPRQRAADLTPTTKDASAAPGGGEPKPRV